jgi:dienelactone hydrolase
VWLIDCPARQHRTGLVRHGFPILGCAALAGALAWQATTVAQVRAQSAGEAEARTRGAFLKLIDRPRVPLAPEVSGRTERNGLVEESLTFAADARERVPTLIIKPTATTGRGPVVIVLHGTGSSKDRQSARLSELAGLGFVAVAIDGRFHGARTRQAAGPASSYENAILEAFRTGREHPFLYDSVWDVMRLVDYLVTRDDVDPARIGLTGTSKGGMETYLSAAVDPRIAVAVPLIGVQSFQWGLDHGGWDSRAWTFRAAIDAAARDAKSAVGAPFMRTFYDRVAPGLYGEFDGSAMLPLIAPRPLLVVNGDSDPRTPAGGVRLAVAAASRAYAMQGASDRFVFHLQPDAGHEVTPGGEKAATEWLVRWLKPAPR